MLPSSWKDATLRDLISLQRGYDLPSQDRVEGDFPIMSAAGLAGFHVKSNVQGPGVVIGRSGSGFGNVHFTSSDYWAHNTALFVKDFKGNHSLYVFYLLSSINFSSYNSGGVQPSLNRNFIYPIRVGIPPFFEQKKIAKILSTWDKAITATERLLENSQQRKKGLMQQLLTGKKRLPGFEGEWESKPISQTGKIISGGTPDTNDSDLWGGDVQWLTPTDITALKTHFIYDTPRKITEKGVKESSATLMPPSSLCVCTRASVGLMAISTTPTTTNQGFKSVIPNNKHDVEFLYYLFSFHRYVFIRYSSGSTFMELSKKDFAKITFDYPPLPEQGAIARVLASASDEIEQLQKRATYLKQEKKALMQQLLTGKRRVQVEAV